MTGHAPDHELDYTTNLLEEWRENNEEQEDEDGG